MTKCNRMDLEVGNIRRYGVSDEAGQYRNKTNAKLKNILYVISYQ